MERSYEERYKTAATNIREILTTETIYGKIRDVMLTALAFVAIMSTGAMIVTGHSDPALTGDAQFIIDFAVKGFMVMFSYVLFKAVIELWIHKTRMKAILDGEVFQAADKTRVLDDVFLYLTKKELVTYQEFLESECVEDGMRLICQGGRT